MQPIKFVYHCTVPFAPNTMCVLLCRLYCARYDICNIVPSLLHQMQYITLPSLLHRIQRVYHRKFPIAPNTLYHFISPYTHFSGSMYRPSCTSYNVSL